MKLSSIQIARKIKGMRRGQSFEVSSPRERHQASINAKILRDTGVIDFTVVTRKDGSGKFIVAAI